MVPTRRGAGGGPALDPDTARRLACDATLTTVHHAAGHLLEPEGTRSTGVRATVLANLLLLCNRHHHAVHEGGFAPTGTARDPRFARPDGTPVVPGHPPTAVLDLHGEQRRTLGLTTTPNTCGSLSYGERFDLALAMDALTDLLQPPHRN